MNTPSNKQDIETYDAAMQNLFAEMSAGVKDSSIKTKAGFTALQKKLDTLAEKYQNQEGLGTERYKLYYAQSYLHYLHGDTAKATQFLQVSENMHGGPFNESKLLRVKLDSAAIDDSQLVDNAVVPKTYTPATQGRRLANYVIDTIGYYVLIIMYFFVIGFVSGLTESGLGLLNYETSEPTLASWVITYLLVFVYFIFFEAVFAKTPGKFITKTTVMRPDGSKASFGQIVARTFCRFIPFEPFSFLPNNNPIGWHDRIPKTIVSYDKS